MGLDVYLTDGPDDEPSYGAGVKSALHPEHICTPDYLRSSYNGSGFNSVVGNACGGRDFAWVFEPVLTDDYPFAASKDGLAECRKRALTLQADFVATEPVGVEFYSAIPLRPDLYDVRSDEDAIKAWRAEQSGNATSNFCNYSNAKGYFYGDPLTVKAILPGKGFMGPGVYIICEQNQTFYREAFDVLIEFIDNALSMEDPHIRWSA